MFGDPDNEIAAEKRPFDLGAKYNMVSSYEE